MTDPIATIEYEAMVFGRHLARFPGRNRRSTGALDQSAYTLLSLLQANGPATISELGTITGLDASTLNRQTAALLRDGYAERIPDPAGGIARKFQTTEHGELTVNEERRASRGALAHVTDDWNETDRAAFARLLRRLNQSIERSSGRTWPRPRRPDSPAPRPTTNAETMGSR